jgi:hypothetical protein
LKTDNIAPVYTPPDDTGLPRIELDNPRRPFAIAGRTGNGHTLFVDARGGRWILATPRMHAHALYETRHMGHVRMKTLSAREEPLDPTTAD